MCKYRNNPWVNAPNVLSRSRYFPVPTNLLTIALSYITVNLLSVQWIVKIIQYAFFGINNFDFFLFK